MINDLTQELSTNFIDYAYAVKRGILWENILNIRLV